MKSKISFKSAAARNTFFGLGIFLCIAVLWGTLFIRTGRTDLHIFLDAANRLLVGQPLYDLTQPNEHTKPPLATLLFVPLTKVPVEILSRVWDFLNVVVYIFLAWIFANQCRTTHVRGLALLGILWTLNNWNQEIRLGQYNVFTLAGLWWASRTKRDSIAGAVAAICVLLKPTNLFFLPMLLWDRRLRPMKICFGVVAALASLSAIYAGMFGTSMLSQHHREWLDFLGPSTAKHFMRFDNYSLLKAIADFFPSVVLLWIVRAFLLLAILWTAIARRTLHERFALTAVFTLYLNPMCWFQNFTLLLPGVIWIFDERLRSAGRIATYYSSALLALYVGLQLFNPAICHASPRIWEWCVRPLPLYFLVASMVFVVLAERSRTQTNVR